MLQVYLNHKSTNTKVSENLASVSQSDKVTRRNIRGSNGGCHYYLKGTEDFPVVVSETKAGSEENLAAVSRSRGGGLSI